MVGWLRRGLGVVIAVVAVLVSEPAPAVAHPTLLFTEPAAETAVAAAPAAVSLVFGEAVTIGGRALAVVDAGGAQVPVAEAATARDGRMVTAKLDTPLRAGTYRVRWRVTGLDGDLVEGEYRFAVGAALSGDGPTTGGGPGVSWPTVPLRWALFAGLAVALGGVIAERFTRSARAENPALPAVRSWAGFGAVAGLVAVVGSAVLLITDTGMEALVRERPGQVLLAEAAGFTVALALIVARQAGWAVLPLGMVAVAEGVRAHANTSAPGWGAVSTAVHLAAAAIWVGALVHAVRAAVVWRARAPAVRWVIVGYARLAIWVFLTVVTTGTATALLVLPLSAVTTTTYGRVLLLKLGLVAVAAALALTARLALRHPDRLTRLRRSARAEALVLGGVLVVTAVLVPTPTPSAGGEQAAPPPPPRGVAIPMGGLAGQIGVYLTASDDQLVVRLTTPRRGDYYDAPPPQDYRLSGRLDPAGEEPVEISFRSCGLGCFHARTGWRDGDNVVSLHAQAPGWRGGSFAALIPWPAQPAGDLVARTAAIMRGLDAIAVHEAVTSDTSTGLPEPRPLLMDGTWFVANVPYGSGVAPIAARISRGPGPIRLALGFPAEARAAELTLDPQGRVAEETLSDGKHLVRHRFVYPDHP